MYAPLASYLYNLCQYPCKGNFRQPAEVPRG